MNLRRTFASIVFALSTTACFSNVETAAREGVQPIEEINLAPAVDPANEKLEITRGNAPGYAWVHARGRVHAPLSKVYEALLVPAVCADRRAVSEWSSKPSNEPGYPNGFIVHNIVRNVITVEFDNTWRQAIGEGTVSAPLEVLVRFQKTNGSSAIEHLLGSVRAVEVGEGITEIEFIEQLKAIQGGGDPAEAYLRDFFASIVAHTKGEALPTY